MYIIEVISTCISLYLITCKKLFLIFLYLDDNENCKFTFVKPKTLATFNLLSNPKEYFGLCLRRYKERNEQVGNRLK